MDTAELLHTLHEHRQWTVTSLFIDHCERGTGVSGLQDGRLFVWDLIKGFCTYEIKAHDGAILSLACAHSYVISLGLDKRLCIWERFLGNLLNTINVSQAYASLLMLTPSLLVTAKPGKGFFVVFLEYKFNTFFFERISDCLGCSYWSTGS